MSRPTADHDKKIKNPASLRPTLGVEDGKQHKNAWTLSSTLLFIAVVNHERRRCQQ